ncbi:MAG: UPF0104 family protein [Cytophagales bacterium]|nr:MAG: UPF0104 family protein [Cytophagales bacterium]
MKKTLLSILKYLLPLGIGIAMFFYATKDISFASVMQQFGEAKYGYLLLGILFFTISNMARAYRWLLLVEPMGYKPSFKRSFLSVMVGYFINLVFPRAGEISRAATIQRLEGIPLTTVLGTIILERVIDVFFLFSLIIALLLVESGKVNELLSSFLGNSFQKITFDLYTILLLGFVGLFVVVIIYFLYQKWKNNRIVQNIRTFIVNLLQGLTSIRKVKNQTAFWFHSLLIWVMYFWMSYILFFCFEHTENLGLRVGFVMLVLGGIGMAAPVQGGIGTYHLLVGKAFTFYGLTAVEGQIMATFMHTTQILIILLVGGISTIISMSLLPTIPKNSQENISTDQKQ